MLVVGLTGGIGSGKSTVAELFAEKNVPIIDTDIISRQIIQPEQPAFKEVVNHFGKSILQPDQQINRKLLREIIFNKPAEKVWLENLLHPIIRAEMVKQINSHYTPYCIAVIPLLIESKFNPMVQRILVVDATEDLQLARVKQRDSLSDELASSILKTQASRVERLKCADDIINNNGKLNDLKLQVQKLHLNYLTLAKHHQSG